MSTVNCLVTNILQNIFFCPQQKKKKLLQWNILRVSNIILGLGLTIPLR